MAHETHEQQGESDLMSSGDAARIADTSRQAVLQAVKVGKLVVARKGHRGKNLFDRKAVLDWARTVRRRPGRADRERPSARSRSVPSPAVAAPPVATPRPAGRSTIADDSIPPAVTQALFEKAASPDVVETYHQLLLDEAAVRRKTADVAGERLELDRLKVRVERRRVERELLREERPNYVRQILGRLKSWIVREGREAAGEASLILQFGERVMEALGDDLVAEVARGGTLLEDAYLRTRATWSRWLETSELKSTDPKAHDEFVRIWIREMTRRNEPRTVPVPAAPPSPPATETKSNKST